MTGVGSLPLGALATAAHHGALLAAANAPASHGGTVLRAGQGNTVSASSLFLHLVLGLGVVLGLLAVLARLARGRVGGRGAVPLRRSPIAVLGRQSLGKGVTVAVVQVGERAYLLGITPTAVRRLGTLAPEELAAPIQARPVDIEPPSLSVVMPGGDGPAPGSRPRGPRPAPTWTSAIEHLRELTVRRA